MGQNLEIAGAYRLATRLLSGMDIEDRLPIHYTSVSVADIPVLAAALTYHDA